MAVLFTPIVLHYSISPGSESALKTMLEHNLDVHAKDKLGGTALHSAAYSGHVNCVKLLIQFGACVDALDMLQHTPIFRACEMGHTEVVNNLILRKFSFDRKISCPFIYYCALSLKEIKDCLAVFVLDSWNSLSFHFNFNFILFFILSFWLILFWPFNCSILPILERPSFLRNMKISEMWISSSNLLLLRNQRI